MTLTTVMRIIMVVESKSSTRQCTKILGWIQKYGSLLAFIVSLIREGTEYRGHHLLETAIDRKLHGTILNFIIIHKFSK